MISNIKIGLLGENIAFKYLIKNGYQILYRNKRLGFDEIDIVAMRVDGTLVFFEVKTHIVREYDAFNPEDNFSFKKRRKMMRACRMFIAGHMRLVDDEKGWETDLLTIRIDKALSCATLRHYRNA